MIPAFLIRPLLYLVAVAAIGAALWYVHHSIDSAGYRRGKAEVTDQYRERDAKATKAANDRIRELETAARAKERDHAQDLADISWKYEGQLEMANAKAADDQRRVAGGFRLRDTAAKCPAPGGDRGVPQVVTSAGERPGETGAELSGPATQFLLAEASRADDVARQLAACQAVTQADRK